MIDLVAGFAQGFSHIELHPFLASLRASGYQGGILLLGDKESLTEAAKWDVDVRIVPKSSMKVHSARFLALEGVLRTLQFEGALLADTRDIIFQKDITDSFPKSGFHAFEEDNSMTIGSCPYNSKWVRLGYGTEMLNAMKDFPISCVGASCGDRDSIIQYLSLLCEEITRLQPKTNHPQDQAAHNWIVRMSDFNSTIWSNEHHEVYTVGYIPRETVRIGKGLIVNRSGLVPAVIHQWDRHMNLIKLVEEKYL